MKTVASLISFLFFISCGSRLYTIQELGLNNKDVHYKEYNLADFHTYVFNICEDIKKETNNSRFYNCPDYFFKLPKTDAVIKVEELYLLIHKTNNLVIYLTTFSHKYIQHQKGFLNDRKIYENKIVLNQTEYAYLGKIDTTSHYIHFPNPKAAEDIILHYDPKTYPEIINITDANIETAENAYTTDEKIPLKEVFRQDLAFKKSDYHFTFSRGSIDSLTYNPQCVYIISRKGKVEIAFDDQKSDSILFKISNRKIRYRPNYFLLPE